MHHANLSRSPAPTPVIHPWDYVAMRRRAAGLSVGQVAQALGGRAYERHLRLLETTGMRISIVADLNVAMPFSDDVYRQLADLPPHQHPRLCQRCGWDERTEVPDCADGFTSWSRDDTTICTRCERQAAA
ncbi:hypothetical protein [Sphingobium limneticum]|uniref:Uncharacterized protein n=1 Tax=Sphingobium limneticum TaxID=1007511 RepID=A0A5J5ICD0_9SPHN|nr:hypothetical protein [Sphingobium limneticum]KAA9020762.1 hypothetical protein F4U96_03600 [Sphingobium limneticum]KAA9033088.1 hypothetical protein F4U95_03600 [Sphingobium limneticum]